MTSIGRSALAVALLLVLPMASCARDGGDAAAGAGDCGIDSPSFTGEGDASYYHDSLAGNPTASGEPYRPSRLTAAHRKLDFGTVVCVTNLDNGRSVEVTVNDRGPFVEGRIIDLSRRAAERLDMIDAGHAAVRISAE